MRWWGERGPIAEWLNIKRLSLAMLRHSCLRIHQRVHLSSIKVMMSRLTVRSRMTKELMRARYYTKTLKRCGKLDRQTVLGLITRTLGRAWLWVRSRTALVAALNQAMMDKVCFQVITMIIICRLLKKKIVKSDWLLHSTSKLMSIKLQLERENLICSVKRI